MQIIQYTCCPKYSLDVITWVTLALQSNMFLTMRLLSGGRTTDETSSVNTTLQIGLINKDGLCSSGKNIPFDMITLSPLAWLGLDLIICRASLWSIKISKCVPEWELSLSVPDAFLQQEKLQETIAANTVTRGIQEQTKKKAYCFGSAGGKRTSLSHPSHVFKMKWVEIQLGSISFCLYSP